MATLGRRAEVQGSVFIREGVIYILWNGIEQSAEAFEADRMPGNMSINTLQDIMNKIEALRDQLDGIDTGSDK